MFKAMNFRGLIALLDSWNTWENTYQSVVDKLHENSGDGHLMELSGNLVVWEILGYFPPKLKTSSCFLKMYWISKTTYVKVRFVWPIYLVTYNVDRLTKDKSKKKRKKKKKFSTMSSLKCKEC